MRGSRVFWLMLFFLLGMGLLLYQFSISNGDLGYYVARIMEMEGRQVNENSLREVLSHELAPADMEIQEYSISKGGLQIMDYYRIKPLYTFAAYLVHQLGIGYVPSARIIALLGYFATVLLVFYWLLREQAEWVALGVAVLLAMTLPMMQLAAMSTPDSWSAFFILLLFFGIYYRWSWLLLLSVAFGAILTRMDNVLTVLVMVWGMRVVNGMPLSRILGATLLLAVLTLVLNWILTDDPYWFRSISYLNNRDEYQWFLADFIKVFTNSFHMVFLVLLVFLLLGGHGQTHGRELWMVAIGYVVISIRFILFPSFQERFFVPFYLLSAIVLLQVIRTTSIIKR